jgi:hypothetical protein
MPGVSDLTLPKIPEVMRGSVIPSPSGRQVGLPLLSVAAVAERQSSRTSLAATRRNN